MSRVTIFDKNGQLIGDVRALTKRTWTLASTGTVGQCEFEISTNDNHATLKYLQLGSIVLVRHGTLPDWVGVIYTPRNWQFGSFKVRAYQAEQILAWRATQMTKLTGTGGGIFRKILNYANAQPANEKPIAPGAIFEDENYREETTGNDALSHCIAVAKRCNQDFDVTHSFDTNGRITFSGNWYKRKGVDTQKWLRQGLNLEDTDNMMEEYGDLWNHVTGYSDASTSGTRVSYSALNEAAIARYGLYQKVYVYSGVTQVATLQYNVFEQLKRSANPLLSLDLNVVNVNGIFNYMRVGNILNVDMNYSGFSGAGYGTQAQVRILGLEHYDAADNRVRIITESIYG